MNVGARNLKRLGFLGIVLALLISFPVAGLVQESDNTVAREFQIPEGIISLDCYEENLERVINFKIDFDNEKVLEPSHISWFTIRTYRSSDDVVLVLLTEEEQTTTLDIYREDGHMSICRHTFVRGGCDYFTCYRKGGPVF